jgi:hypothetical protein
LRQQDGRSGENDAHGLVSEVPMPKLAPCGRPDEDRPHITSPAWITYREAMNSGWGATSRLCLILTVRWGLPVSGVVKLTSVVLAHVR